jgi:predicted phage-related endonuclease
MSTALALSPASDPAERRLGIGGSDIPAILGLSPYKTALDVYLEKRGLWVDEFESEAAHWGNVMEPVLAREYARRYECAVIRSDPTAFSDSDYLVEGLQYVNGPLVNFDGIASRYLRTLTHPNYPWVRGHVDGIGISEVGSPRHVCEFKTADSRLSGYWGAADSDEVPEFYLAQVMWYLMLADLDVAHLAVLIGGNRFLRYIIPRNQTLIDVMLERAEEFWHRVETLDPPDPEPGERGAASLSRMYPKGSLGKELEATPTLFSLSRELHELRALAKQTEEEKTSIENYIKAVMADAVRLNLGPKSYLSWSNNKGSEQVNWEMVARDLHSILGGSDDGFRRVIAENTATKPGPRVFRAQGLDKLFS